MCCSSSARTSRAERDTGDFLGVPCAPTALPGPTIASIFSGDCKNPESQSSEFQANLQGKWRPEPSMFMLSMAKLSQVGGKPPNVETEHGLRSSAPPEQEAVAG